MEFNIQEGKWARCKEKKELFGDLGSILQINDNLNEKNRKWSRSKKWININVNFFIIHGL